MNQTIVNIRTVASIGREYYFLDRFTELVASPYRYRNSISFIHFKTSVSSGSQPY